MKPDSSTLKHILEGKGQKPEAPTLWAQLNTMAMVKFLLLAACGWVIVQLLAYFKLVVVIFVAATILAFLLSHPVGWLHRWLPRGAAVGVMFGCSLVVLGAIAATIGFAILTQGQRLISSLEDVVNSLQPRIDALETLLAGWNLELDLASLEAPLREQALGLLGQGFSLLQGTFTGLIVLIFINVITLFMLIDGHRIWTWMLKRLPPDKRDRFNTIVQQNLLGFFWGRLLLSLFFGVSTSTVFWLLKVPFALVLGVMAGLFDLIPGIGATMGIGLVCLLLLSQSLWLALKALIACVILQQIEENILMPHIMRDSLDINPVVMFFALIVGARVAGLLGIFLSIPVAGVIVSWLEIDEMRGGQGKSGSLPPGLGKAESPLS